MSIHVRLRHELLGGHRHVRVFVGVDKDHLQKSGDLVFREDERIDEWTPFLGMLRTMANPGLLVDMVLANEEEDLVPLIGFDDIEEEDGA